MALGRTSPARRYLSTELRYNTGEEYGSLALQSAKGRVHYSANLAASGQ